ncbi:MAG: hypothetical protein ACOCV1_04925 [Bacillota bacterium]
MIIKYNKYVNNLIREKLELDIGDIVDKLNNNITDSFENIKNKLFMNTTADGFNIEENGEYYAVVKYNYKGDNEAKKNLTGKYFWVKVKLIEIEEKFYKYDIIESDINIPKEEGSILDDKKDILLVKRKDEKVPVNRINGFYLYKEKSDITVILDFYGVKYTDDDLVVKSKKDTEEKKDKRIKSGTVYQIINSKGNEVNIGIIKVSDNLVFGEDMDSFNRYNNMKIDSFNKAKYEDTIYNYIRKEKEQLKNWKNTQGYKELKEKEQIVDYTKNIYKKLENFKRIIDRLLKEKKLKVETKDAFVGLKTSVNSIQSRINKSVKDKYNIALRKSKKATTKPVEPVEDKTETKEEKKVKEELIDNEKKAKDVQMEVPKPKESEE